MLRSLCVWLGILGGLCLLPQLSYGKGPKSSAPCCDSVETCCDVGPGDGWLQSWMDDAGYGCSLSDRGIQVRGWLAQGITGNPDDPPNRENFPVTFNDRANEYQLNQLYLIAERPVATCGCNWELGGRVDLLFGSDYYFTTATGLEVNADGTQRWNSPGPRGAGPASAALYGLAMPQLYGEIYAPIAGGTNIKLGHFYSPLGYERVMAPENFFYSHSYSLQYGVPLTHTGAVGEVQLFDRLSVMLGGTLGWNSWDSSNNQWGVLAGLGWNSWDDRTSVKWAIHTGEDSPPGVNPPGFFAGPTNPDNVTISSFVLTRQITDRLQYVFQQDMGIEENGAFAGGTFRDAHWYGINQYLLYAMNECWGLGMRFEWFRDEDHSRILDLATAGVPVNGSNYYGLTAGLNWTPCENIIVRPEVRWDWSDAESPVLGVGGPFEFFQKDNQLTVAFDVIARF